MPRLRSHTGTYGYNYSTLFTNWNLRILESALCVCACMLKCMRLSRVISQKLFFFLDTLPHRCPSYLFFEKNKDVQLKCSFFVPKLNVFQYKTSLCVVKFSEMLYWGNILLPVYFLCCGLFSKVTRGHLTSHVLELHTTTGTRTCEYICIKCTIDL